MNYKNSKSKSFKKVYKPKKRGLIKPSKYLNKTIQKVINKNEEDKIATAKFPITSFNSGINSSGDIIGVMPALNLGTNNANRIGNQIMAKSLMIYANLLVKNTATTTSLSDYMPNSRIGVRVMIVQPKTVMNRPDVTNNQGAWLSRLLRDGASSVAFDGSLDNFYLPINTEAITKYYDKKFYFKSDSVYLPPTNTEAITIQTLNTVKRLNIPVISKLKKILFDQSFDASYSTNYTPVMLVGYCHLNGDSPDITTTAITMNFTSVLKYQDS